MQGTKSKLLLISALIGFLALTALMGVGLFVFGNSNKKSKSQEERFSEMVSLNVNPSLQDSALARLKRLRLEEGSTKVLNVREIIGFDFEKIIMTDGMVIDYAVPCPDLPGTFPLADKEFCQFGIVYLADGSSDYLRESCQYDLMNLSRGFDLINLSMAFPIELIYPTDKVEITFSKGNGGSFFIEPITHKEVVLNCRKIF